MKKSSAWCMLVPGLVILFLFLMIPLLRVLVPSVFTGDYPFSAYVDFFKDEYYRKIFLRTVKIAVITTFVCMVGGIPTAYFISRCDKKWRGLLLSASIFPMMTNSVIRSFAWINILGSNGIINKAMIAMGLIEKPMKLLYTDFSIIIGSVYLFLPLMIVTVAGVMENIDDGGTEPRSFKNGSVHESHFPDESSWNHRRRYSGIYRNPDRLYDTAVIRRQQQHGNGDIDLPESDVCQ